MSGSPRDPDRTHSSRRSTLAWLAGISLASALPMVSRPAFADDAPVPPPAGHQPDPAALPHKVQWVFDIAATGGVPRITNVRRVELERAESTARLMGRYALELYIGNELLDRIRFNVPLTGDGPKLDRGPFGGPGWDQVTTRFAVRLAHHPRATVLAFVDRAEGSERRYWWPPQDDGVLRSLEGPAVEPPIVPLASESPQVRRRPEPAERSPRASRVSPPPR